MKALLVAAAAVGTVAALCAWTPQGQAFVQSDFGLDRRPIKTILLIGNSRTYYHDMPAMVSRISASARLPYRLTITTLAWPGASLEENWTA